MLLAAIIAVAMSNASGALNSLAASSVLDFSILRGRNSQLASDPAKLLKLSRRSTLLWGAALVCFGLIHWGPVLEAGLTVASLPFGSLLGLFLLGTFDRRSNSNGSLSGMVAGLAAVLLVFRYTSIAFTWFVLVGACVTFIVGAIVSRAWLDRVSTT